MSNIYHRQQEDVSKLILTDLCVKLGNGEFNEFEVVEEVIPLPEEFIVEEDNPDSEEDNSGGSPLKEKDSGENAKSVSSQKEFKCLVCGKILASVKGLKRHVKSYHEKPHKCEVCGKFFRNASELTQHKQTHDGYVCKVCGKKYSTVDSLRVHRNRKHAKELDVQQEPTEQVVCNMCEKSFKNVEGLRVHNSRIHKENTESVQGNQEEVITLDY